MGGSVASPTDTPEGHELSSTRATSTIKRSQSEDAVTRATSTRSLSHGSLCSADGYAEDDLSTSWPLRETVGLVCRVFLRELSVEDKPGLPFDEDAYRSKAWLLIHPLLTSTTTMYTGYTTRAVRPAPPTLAEVESFVATYARRGLVSSESLIVSLIYVQRLQSLGCTLSARSWRPLFLGALILSAKMVDDCVTWNKEFQTDEFRVRKLSELEAACLKKLDYRLFVGSQEYARYHYALRTMAERSQRWTLSAK